MSAFCGWLGVPENDLPPTHTLRSMSEAFRGRRLSEQSISSPMAAIWVTAEPAAGCVSDAEEPWVGIIGTPRWRDAALAEEQRARGAAAALRRAYRAHGPQLLDHLAGAFALAVLDRAAGQALIAIDRMGVHGLYYAETRAGELVFGSTADLVRAHPRVGATIPLQSIYNYLHAFVCRSPGTIYAEQRKLGPGQCLRWNGRARVETYWRIPYAPDRSRSPDDLAEELTAKVRQAVRRSLPGERADGVGAFLSGGLDSSTVAGMLAEVTQGPAQTFTIGFAEAPYDEMRYADAVIRKFGTRAHRYYLTADDTAAMAPKVAAFYDEPFGNSSALPAYFCAAQAQAEGLGCILAGDGGDEILAGNSRYLEQQVYERFGRLPAPLRRALKLAVFHAPLLSGTSLGGKAQRYIARAEVRLPERMEAFNFYQIERMAEVFEPDALREIDLEAPWREMRAVYESATSSDSLQRMMHLDLKQALADSDLKKVTGMCELAGIDVRFPFLDDDLVAFCATIPPELHLQGGRLRAFFKDAFTGFLPPEVIAKKKHGFGMPFYEWTRDHPGLRTLAYDSLTTLRGRHLLRDGFIDKVLAEHARPEATLYDGLVWDLMMLELWLESHRL